MMAFENIIKAIYRQPYTLKSTEVLKNMTEQADFHCCLPVVSNSLYAAFYRSPDFLANVNKDRELLLLLAYKLRHVELFNDCIILISGYWPPGNCKLQSATKMTDEKLKRPAENVYSRTGVRIAHSQQQILSYPSRTDSIDRGLMQTDFRSAEVKSRGSCCSITRHSNQAFAIWISGVQLALPCTTT